VISGAGGVQQEGTGVLTLTGNSAYTGGTQVTAGVLAFNNANALGAGAVTLSTGTELRGSATAALNDTVSFATGTTGATLSATTGATFTVKNLDTTNTGALTFGSTGNVGTVAIGSGMTLGSNITAATVAFGTLSNGGELGQLVASGQVTTTVNAGATLALNDLSTEVASLKGAGAVKLGTKAATVLTLDSATFGGVISGSGSVDVNGTTIFTGANTYTGGTKIAANQALQLGNGATTGSIMGPVSVGSGATLEFDRSNAYSFAGAISGTGGVEQNGAGVLTLTGSSTYSGGTQINSGVLAFSNATALGSGSVTLGGGSELRGSGTATLNDAVSYGGTTSATISTTGTLTLTNLAITDTGKLNFGSAGNVGAVVIPSVGTYSANANAQIEVAFGTLRNGGGLNALTSSVESTQVDTGATLAVNDFSLTIQNLTGAGTVNLGTKAATVLTLEGASFQGTISGAGHVSAPGINGSNGSGVVVLSKANTYTGGTTVSGGTLVANNPTGSATGTGPVMIDSGATIGGHGTVSGAMTLQSGGTVKPGAGSPGVAGTKFHGSSLLWEGGAALELQIGSTADELLLSGALTKGTAGTFTIEIDDAGIVAGNYTLATFASTTFSLSDFNLVLPTNYTGTLVETSTSLSIQNLQDPVAVSDMPAIGDEGTVLTPMNVPEPGSGLLLAFGGSALLAWRRRRVAG
jgi:autotransporter-associated beta strand protein